MNKKELAEIKKQYTPERCTITRICGCYVDGDKNIKTRLAQSFLSLSEEEEFKYLTIFKKTLSGTIGKNLLNLDVPLEQEKEGGAQEFLLRLRDSKLKEDSLVDEFYQKIIANYEYGENYYIILIHVVYDVPGKSTDGSEMFDASDSVYEYLLCSICPVQLSKPGLCYNVSDNIIENHIQDWLVEQPVKGFLFPVFNDRTTDIHSILYYSKKPEELLPEFISRVLGCELPLSANDQKETFDTIVSDTLGEECEYEIVKNIHETLNAMLDDAKENPEPLTLSKYSFKQVLEQSGVPDEKLQTFDESYEKLTEETPLLVSNIANTHSFQVKTPDVVVKVSPACAGLVETRVIDGRPCLVIAINEQLEVNGVAVASPKPADN